MACSLSLAPLASFAGWRGRSTAGPSHSDVPSQAHSARLPISTGTHREVLALMVRAEEKAGPEDVGEQALTRGLDTAFPFFRLGLSWSRIGRRSDDRPHNGLVDELGIIRELELADAMRLQPVGAPGALHRACADAGLLRHHGCGPVWVASAGGSVCVR